MKKGLLTAYVCAGALLMFGILGTVFLFQPSDMDTVQIIRDEEILYTIDLNSAENRFIRIDYGESYNIIEIKDGQIRVSEAGCKDNTCVKMGWLSSRAAIVCLPNHLIIKFLSADDEIDAVVG